MVKLQIFGTGCPKCQELAERAESAAQELGIEYEVEKVKELNKIMEFGVMITPALAVNGEIKVFGRVPSLQEAMEMIR